MKKGAVDNTLESTGENTRCISIIITNWNKKDLLRECLNSIVEKTNYLNFSVIIVDNGSIDSSVKMVRKEFPMFMLVSNKRNLGFTKASNQGIRIAFKRDTDYFFLLNNDTRIVRKNWLKKLVKSIESDPKIGIMGCRLVSPDGRSTRFPHVTSLKEVDGVSGAAFLVKKKVVEKIGLLDEKFSPAYGEETDYCWRARAAGFMVFYNPSVTIIHYGGATAKELFGLTRRERLVFKHGVRLRLLNFSLRGIVTNFFDWIFFEKKDMSRPIAPSNIKLRRGWPKRLLLLIYGYWKNLGDFSDILWKRRNRLARIWY